MISVNNSYLIAIVIPMYNEIIEAARCIAVVEKYIDQIPAITLIVVDDGSSDGTAQVLNKLKKKYQKNLSLVTHSKNRGYGAAIRSGITAAVQLNADYVLFMDADLTNHPRYIKNFVKEIPSGWDCIKASRYIKGGGMLGVPTYRQIISRTGNFILRLFFQLPIHDHTNGFRLVRTKMLKNIPYKMSDFSLILEELFYLKKIGAKITEIPNLLTSRKKSSSHFVYNYKLLKNYIQLVLSHLD